MKLPMAIGVLLAILCFAADSIPTGFFILLVAYALTKTKWKWKE